MSSLVLGCIADDFTGASDLASNLVDAGLRVVQLLGLPDSQESVANADAVVIALRTRSAKREAAIDQSLAAIQFLQDRGAKRFYFKYCSTFLSTEQGNIGPVVEALLAKLDAPQTILCPAFPRQGRTVYSGNLFVGGRLLSESEMANHPITPMKDSNLPRLLSKQTELGIGVISYPDVEEGKAAILERLRYLYQSKVQCVIVDTLHNRHLQALAMACADMTLLTGSSGLAARLPEAYRESGLLSNQKSIPSMPKISGRTAILSGSCSQATQQQVAFMKSICPAYLLDGHDCVVNRVRAIDEALKWSRNQIPETPIMIYSTASPTEVARIQATHRPEIAAKGIEATLAAIAQQLVEHCGVRRLIIAGGETSGAIVTALGVKSLRTGPSIVTSVSWSESTGPSPLAIALKPGNFGGPDFFQRAIDMLP